MKTRAQKKEQANKKAQYQHQYLQTEKGKLIKQQANRRYQEKKKNEEILQKQEIGDLKQKLERAEAEVVYLKNKLDKKDTKIEALEQMVLKTYETHAKIPPIDDDSDINENVEATFNKNKQFKENYFLQACMKDPKLYETMISFSPQEFHNFVNKHSFLLDQFTERGTASKRAKRQETKYSKPFEIFITLLWLQQYSKYSFL
jgi:hypothetical protein